MPKLVNYSDRFDGVREAVFALTLRDGPDAISLPAVAAEAHLSPRSLQRLIASTGHLPHLGLQWAERERRRRKFHDRPRTTDARTGALEGLLETLPGSPKEPDDERVWWALVTTFEGTREWARGARAEHAVLVEALATALLRAVELSDDDRAYEHARLCALVDGTTRRILGARLTHEAGAVLVRRHVLDVLRRHLSPADDAA